MTFTATITSKRQLTIPVKLFKFVGLKQGDQVIISVVNNELLIKKGSDLVKELSGSVSVPKKLLNIDPDQAIKLAKQKHFKNKA